MKKVSVTYHAPKGESKMVTAFGHTFFDGKSEEVTVEDFVHEKLAKHPHFQCGKATDITPEQQAKDEAKGR